MAPTMMSSDTMAPTSNASDTSTSAGIAALSIRFLGFACMIFSSWFALN